MKIKKIWWLLGPIIVAFVVFVGLYLYYNREDENSFNVSDKKWIEENQAVVVDFGVISNYPVYGDNGVFYQFVSDFEDATGLEFNIIPYLKTSSMDFSGYGFRVLSSGDVLGDKDLLLAEDVYVTVAKKDIKINSVVDFKNVKVGTLSDDSGEVSYYLKSGTGVSYKTYSSINLLFEALDNEDVDMIIIPNIMYLDKTIASDEYSIIYTLAEMKKKIVLSLSDNNDELNSIISKYFTNWKNKYYVSSYNSKLLSYYVEENNINDKTKALLLSKTYVYGYVENIPYESVIDGNLVGICGEYINRIKRLTNIDFVYKKYDSVTKLKEAVNKGEVDIYFNYYDYANNGYIATSSPFIEEYVVLGKVSSLHVIKSFEALKGQRISMISGTSLYNYFVNNGKAIITPYTNISKLVKNSGDNVLVIDREYYDVYKNSTFKNYEILYMGIMSNDYTFMVKNDSEAFYDLFNYIINTNSYYNYRNVGLASLNPSLLERTTFEQLYVIILLIIFVPIGILVVSYFVIKNKNKVKKIRKEERRKYTDMLTSLKNRNYLSLNIKSWNQNKVYPQAVVVIDLNNIKYVNDNYGYEMGDKLIVDAASLLINTQLENSEIIRTDGNEFLVYLIGYSEQQIAAYTKKLAKEMKNLPYNFGAAVGYSMILDEINNIADAINDATLKMRKDKEEYNK